VRTLLQRVFEKTDTHRQSELVRLMLAHGNSIGSP
jgi:DNA-binding CsgD family transcriptional regulator